MKTSEQPVLQERCVLCPGRYAARILTHRRFAVGHLLEPCRRTYGKLRSGKNMRLVAGVSPQNQSFCSSDNRLSRQRHPDLTVAATILCNAL